MASAVLIAPSMMNTVATAAALVTLCLTSAASADEAPRRGFAAAIDDDHAPPRAGDDLSTLGGQLVPVGQRNEYLTTHKRMNLAIDPLTLLVGWVDVEAQFALSDRVALSASFARMSVDDTTGIGAALTAPIYFRKVFSGPYLEPGVVMYQFTDRGEGATSGERVAGPQMSFGWQWMSDSGFNVAIAGGAARIGDASGDGAVVPQGYFRTGYAF